jgi:hypothetical protein
MVDVRCGFCLHYQAGLLNEQISLCLLLPRVIILVNIGYV